MSDLDALRKALEVSPDNIPLILLLARGLIANFELEQARQQLQHVLSLDAGNLEGQLGMAEVANMLGLTSEASVRLEALCNNSPEYAPAWLVRATIALHEEEAFKAREYYERAVALDPSNHDPELSRRIDEAGGTVKKESPSPLSLSTGGGFGAASLDPNSHTEPSFPDRGSIGLEFSEKSDSDFSKVGGMDEVKEDIRMKILYPLQNRELFQAYGKKAGGGLMVYGPPGCGKTMISRATAGEIDARYLSVGLHHILDMWIGRSEEKLHELFEFARRNAPAVLFFDEVDALAADRKDMRTSAGRTLINQFLAELDGGNDNNDGVLVIGATNAPWHLDSAFLRPGRFDRVVFVPPPDAGAREAIICIMAEGKPVAGLDPQDLAKKTQGFSGADIKAIFDQAVEASLSEALNAGKIVPVTQKQLVKAAKKLNPSTRMWFESAKNYALYSNQSGFYDDVLDYLGIKK